MGCPQQSLCHGILTAGPQGWLLDVPDWVSPGQMASVCLMTGSSWPVKSLPAMLVNFCLLCLAYVSAHLTCWIHGDSLTHCTTHTHPPLSHLLNGPISLTLHVSSFSLFYYFILVLPNFFFNLFKKCKIKQGNGSSYFCAQILMGICFYEIPSSLC